jgi:DNA-binding MurR/RpiR family transcriptional regulator
MNESLDNLIMKMSSASKESVTYEKLAYYIEKNMLRIIFMTAGEVAAETNVSQGSVTRFCTALGYRGYNDFLRHLQNSVSEKITAPQRLQYTVSGREDDKIADILNTEQNNLNEIKQLLSLPEYEKLVSAFVKAKEIYLMSARMSATLLPYTAYILNKIRNGVHTVTPEKLLWDTLRFSDPKDKLIFCIVFPRYPNVLLEKMRELKEEGFRIVAITDSVISPASQIADLVLPIPVTVSSIFDIYSMPILFVNLLMRDIAKKTGGVDKRLDALERLDRENDIYYTNTGE